MGNKRLKGLHNILQNRYIDLKIVFSFIFYNKVTQRTTESKKRATESSRGIFSVVLLIFLCGSLCNLISENNFQFSISIFVQ